MLRFSIIFIIVFSVFSSITWANKSMCDVEIVGPLVVCDGDINTYTITGIPPGAVTNVYITMGAIGTFFYDNNGTITVQWFEFIPTGKLCIDYAAPCGSGSLCIDVIVGGNLPNFNLIGDISVCVDEMTTYNITPPLPNGVNVAFTVQNGTITSSNQNSVTVEWGSTSSNGQICASVTNPCDNDVTTICKDVDIYQPPIPPLISLLQNAICIGETHTINILPDDFPFINWTVNNATLQSPNNENNITVLFDQEGTVEICVTVGVGCNNDVQVCKTIYVSFPPDPILTSEPTCNLEILLLADNVRFSSIMEWRLISGPGALIFNAKDNSATYALANTPGTYIVSFTETVGICTITKEFEFTLSEALSIDNLVTNCTNQNGYKIRFEILGGTEPLSVNGVEIPNRNFSSQIIPFGQPYSFLIEDFNLCQLLIEGVGDCPCSNSAGTMKQNLLTACDSLSITALSDSNSIFTNGDIGVYILHNSSSDTLGKIYSISSDPTFAKQDSMDYGIIYYISYVVGPTINNAINFNANCLLVSIGQPVVFYKSPDINIFTDSIFCGSTGSFKITIDSIDTKLTWQIRSLFNNNIPSIFDSVLNTIIFTSEDYGNHFVNVESYNKGCIGKDSVEIILNEKPIFKSFSVECNSSAKEFIVNVNLAKGKIPYYFNGIEILDSLFQSNTYSTGSNYEFVFSDSNGCFTDTLIGFKNCDCISFAGSMKSDTLIVCNTESLKSEYNIDYIFDVDDSYFYLLHDGDQNEIGKVFSYNQTGEFYYTQDLVLDKVYYVTRVVGDSINGFIDSTDLCISYSNGQPIIFNSSPRLPLIDKETYCEGIFDIKFIEQFSFAYNVRVLGNADEIEIMETSDNSVKINSINYGKYKLEFSSENLFCVSFDTVDMIIKSIPLVSNISYKCSDDKETYIATLYNNSEPIFVNNDTLIDSISYVFPADDIPIELKLLSIDGCSNLIMLNYSCNCSSINGNMASDTIKVCGDSLSNSAIYLENGLEDGDTSFYILHTSANDNIGNIIAASTFPSFRKNDLIEYGKVYFISYINLKKSFINNLNDPCISIAKGQPIIFNFIPSIDLAINVVNCETRAAISINTNGNNYFIELIDGPDNGQFNFVKDTLTTSIPGEYFYNLISENFNCNSKKEFSISLNDSPIIASEVINCIGESYQVIIDIEGGSPPYEINNLPFIGASYLSTLIKSDSFFAYSIIDNNGCETEERIITKSCICFNNAGSFSNSDTIVCSPNDFIVPLPTGVEIQNDAGINYQLTINLENGKDSTIQFQGNVISFEEWYIDRNIFISPIVGSIDQNGIVDLNDVCTKIGEPMKIKWEQPPVLITNDDIKTCDFTNLQLPISIKGALPFEILIEWENTEKVFLINELTNFLSLTQFQIDDYSTIKISSIKDRFCFTELNKTIQINSGKDWEASIESEFTFTDTLNMVLNFDNNIEGLFDIKWIFENNEVVNNSNSFININKEQIGNTLIIISDENRCIDSLFTLTRIEEKEKEVNIVFPNMLNPNDPLQGFFTINNSVNIANIDYFKVFDRWGNLVFNVSNQKPENFMWSGNCFNSDCQEGVYIYAFQFTDFNGNKFRRLGDVTILND